MNDISFLLVMDSVKQTINQLIVDYNLTVTVLKNDKTCYRVIIEFKNSMGEIIVSQPDFAPYRFVQIEILSSISDEFKQIYYWGDENEDDLESIIFHIKKGIDYGMDFDKQ